jgi:hypothetical protein
LIGGFWSAIVGATVTFFIMFFLEGLQRTGMRPFIVIVMLGGGIGHSACVEIAFYLSTGFMFFAAVGATVVPPPNRRFN